MPRKPKTPKNKMYFTLETEEAIIAYNKSESLRERNQLYVEKIKYPFEKIAENVLNTYKFSYFDDGPSDVKREVVSQMISKIHMFQEGKGKAFSYFTIVARNYLILNNNANYKRYKDTDVMSGLPESFDTENNFREEVRNDEHRTFNVRMLEYWDKHLENFFPKKRDMQIADAVLELFRRAEYIENFNKKSLYLLIREMTGHPTHYITKVVNKMKERQMELYNEFDKHGDIKI